MYWHAATRRQLVRGLTSRRADRLPTEDHLPPSLEADDIRRERVERTRREIAAGVYDTPERWQAALDRLFDQLEQG